MRLRLGYDEASCECMEVFACMVVVVVVAWNVAMRFVRMVVVA